jgi:hypothetical protein
MLIFTPVLVYPTAVTSCSAVMNTGRAKASLPYRKEMQRLRGYYTPVWRLFKKGGA